MIQLSCDQNGKAVVLLVYLSLFISSIFLIDISRKVNYIMAAMNRKKMNCKMNGVPMEKSHVQTTPGICGGKPHIAGHRIRVQDIVIWHEKLGLSADEILLHFPTLTFSDIYAALSYYFDHQEQIDNDIKEEEAFSESFLKRHPSKLSLTYLD